MTMSFLIGRKAIQERLPDTSSQAHFSPTKKETGIFHGGIMMVAGAGGAKFSDLPLPIVA